MAHVVRAIVGRREVLEVFQERVRVAQLVRLQQGFTMVPATKRVLAQLSREHAAVEDVVLDGFEQLNGRLRAALEQLSLTGPVAFIETEYFAGVGSQAAALFGGGNLSVVETSPEEIVPHRQAINIVLRELGVHCSLPGQDEFDAVGLGQFRDMNEWELSPA